MRNQLAANIPTSTLVSRLRNGSRLASRLDVLKVVLHFTLVPEGFLPSFLTLLLLTCLTPKSITPSEVVGRARDLLNPQMVVL